MKAYWITRLRNGRRLLSIAVAVASIVTTAQARTFTDNQGRTVEANLTGIAAGNVVLVTDQGSKLTIPIGQLSADDQKFVEQWRLRNPDIKLSYNVSKKSVGDRDTSRSDGTRRAKQQRCFEVEVRNLGFDDISNLKFEYTLFVGFNDRYADQRTGISKRVQGTAEIDLIPTMRSGSFTTDPVKTVNHDSMKSNTAGSVQIKTFQKYRTDLVGIKIKTFFGDTLVDTYEYGKVK